MVVNSFRYHPLVTSISNNRISYLTYFLPTISQECIWSSGILRCYIIFCTSNRMIWI
nr:MAG TPA: hypothetical protein [Caudoviricetes sp.]